MSKRENIHFILVRTQFASNLGSSVRALKNMGFANLCLIEPECEVGVEARARAMKGASILDGARFFPSLAAALDDIGVLAATTARFQGARKQASDLRTFASQRLPELSNAPLGIVFGPEDNGLRQEELALCQYRIRISCGSEFGVLNLAQAVAIISYELHLGLSSASEPRVPVRQASAQQLQSLLQRVDRRLRDAAVEPYLEKERAMHRLRGIISRAHLDPDDVSLLHQLLSLEPLEGPKS